MASLASATVPTALRNFSGSATRQTTYVVTMMEICSLVVVSVGGTSRTLMRESNRWTRSIGAGHLKYRPGLVISRSSSGLPNRVMKADSVSRT